MQITFLQNGKTEEADLKDGISIFEKRLEHYVPYKSEVIPALKNARNMPVAKQKQAISKMTFSHQMIRLLFTEQLYRAFTILKGEPYHNA